MQSTSASASSQPQSVASVPSNAKLATAGTGNAVYYSPSGTPTYYSIPAQKSTGGGGSGAQAPKATGTASNLNQVDYSTFANGVNELKFGTEANNPYSYSLNYKGQNINGTIPANLRNLPSSNPQAANQMALSQAYEAFTSTPHIENPTSTSSINASTGKYYLTGSNQGGNTIENTLAGNVFTGGIGQKFNQSKITSLNESNPTFNVLTNVPQKSYQNFGVPSERTSPLALNTTKLNLPTASQSQQFALATLGLKAEKQRQLEEQQQEFSVPGSLQSFQDFINKEIGNPIDILASKYIYPSLTSFSGPYGTVANLAGQNLVTSAVSIPQLPTALYQTLSNPPGVLAESIRSVRENPSGFLGTLAGASLLGLAGSKVLSGLTTSEPGVPTSYSISIPNGAEIPVKINFENIIPEEILTPKEMKDLANLIGHSTTTRDITVVKTPLYPSPIQKALGIKPSDLVQIVPSSSKLYNLEEGGISLSPQSILGKPATQDIYTIENPGTLQKILFPEKSFGRQIIKKTVKIPNIAAVTSSNPLEQITINPAIGGVSPQITETGTNLPTLRTLQSTIYQQKSPFAIQEPTNPFTLGYARKSETININPEASQTPSYSIVETRQTPSGTPYALVKGSVIDPKTGLPSINYYIAQFSRAARNPVAPEINIPEIPGITTTTASAQTAENLPRILNPLTASQQAEYLDQLNAQASVTAKQVESAIKSGKLPAEGLTFPQAVELQKIIQNSDGTISLQKSEQKQQSSSATGIKEVPLIGPGSAQRYSYVPQKNGKIRYVYDTVSGETLPLQQLLDLTGRTQPLTKLPIQVPTASSLVNTIQTPKLKQITTPIENILPKQIENTIQTPEQKVKTIQTPVQIPAQKETPIQIPIQVPIQTPIEVPVQIPVQTTSTPQITIPTTILPPTKKTLKIKIPKSTKNNIQIKYFNPFPQSINEPLYQPDLFSTFLEPDIAKAYPLPLNATSRGVGIRPLPTPEKIAEYRKAGAPRIAIA